MTVPDWKNIPKPSNGVGVGLPQVDAVVGYQETTRECYILVICDFPPMDEFQEKAICS